MMPTASEAAQLLRLRALRVRRAEERQNEAKAAVDAAIAQVRARQATIAAVRGRIAALEQSIVGELGVALPRWSGAAKAERDRLADTLEREEYALLDDERALEKANEKLHQARVELARARAREDVVHDLAAEAKKLRLRVREQKAEVDLEDRPVRAAA